MGRGWSVEAGKRGAVKKGDVGRNPTGARRHHVAIERWSERREARFFEIYAATGSVRRAAIAAGTDPNAMYQRRKRYPEFAARWAEAEAAAIALFEDEAIRRAVEGHPELIVSMGKVVTGEDGKPLYARKYSDSLLKQLLARFDPEHYGEKVLNQVQHLGADGKPIDPMTMGMLELRRMFSGLSDETLRRMRTELEAPVIEHESVEKGDE